MKYLWLLCSVLVLTACGGTPTQPASFFNPQMDSAALNASATSEEIQHALAESDSRWNTLQASGVIRWYSADGSTQAYREQAWLDPAQGRYKVLLQSESNPADHTLRFSNGVTQYNLNLTSGLVESSPYHAAEAGQMWGQIGTPLTEALLPMQYAQSAGSFSALKIETIAGREALMVEWRYAKDSQPAAKMWLDTSTAVILKMQEYAIKDGSGALQGEREVEQIIFNLLLDDSLFAMPADAPQANMPTPVESVPLLTESAAGNAPIGELYFFLQPRQARAEIQLARVSAACIAQPQSCPALEKIPLPFALNFTLSALNWSPDGSRAAFAYPDNPEGTPQKLFLFDPAAQTWNAIAEFPYIDPPFWSPDGKFIAFRAQDGYGAEEVYLIGADGANLRSVSAGLPAEGRPYIMDGWHGDALLMRSALGGGLYRVRASDGAAQALFDAALTKFSFVASPDAALFAYDEYEPSAQTHALKTIAPNGELVAEVARFLGGGLYPIVWSPDSAWIAFNHYSSFNNGEPTAEVYLAAQDGSRLSLTYRGNTVGRLVFSPDGQYLLVEETTSISGGHLFTVNLATLEAKMLSAPGLSTDYDWYAPSWRP